MATTTNYGWTTPDNTAYVKDGASAIRTLGSSVDTSMFAALNGKPTGNVLLNTTTFSAQSSVSISSVFSSTYDAYTIEWSAIASTGTDIVGRVRTGATDLSSTYFTSGYLYSTAGAISGYGAGVTDRIYLAQFGSAGYSSGSIKFMNPALARYTNFIHDSTSTNQPIYHGGGSVQNTTTYDGFTLFTNGTGTMTGTIRVFGVKNS